MRVTIQYIPLSKIKPDLSNRMTERIVKIRSLMWDCMHLIAVRKDRKDGSFTIISGVDRFEYLRNHTNKKYAPCLVDENKGSPDARSWLQRCWISKLLSEFPDIELDKVMPASISIIRSFLKQEPRFANLSKSQQLRVLLLGIRYKRTAVLSMRSMVDNVLTKK